MDNKDYVLVTKYFLFVSIIQKVCSLDSVIYTFAFVLLWKRENEDWEFFFFFKKLSS